MLKIYLVRHGQNLDNARRIINGRRDEPLTDRGIAQAYEAGYQIKAAELTFDYIYTSPLDRAKHTAEIIAQTIGGPQPVVDHDLIERDFGVMTGIEQSRVDELCSPAILKTADGAYFLSPAGAETSPELLVCAGKLLSKVQAQHQAGSILLVGHAELGKMIYAAYYGLSWRDVLTSFYFGNSELLLLAEDSDARETHVFKKTYRAVVFDFFGTICADMYMDWQQEKLPEQLKGRPELQQIARLSDLGEITEAEFFERLAKFSGVPAGQIARYFQA